LSANLLFADLLREVDRRIQAALKRWRVDLTQTTGVLPGYALPVAGPAAPGGTGTGYPPQPHSTDWADVTGTPTTLSGYGITDAASDAELAAHAADTTAVHGIADTSLLITADDNARVGVRKNSTGSTSTRRRLNLIEGSGVTLTVADDSVNEEVDITIAASGGGSSITIEEVDGTPTESAPTKLIFPNGTLSIVGHEVTYTPAEMINPMTTAGDVITGGSSGTPQRLAVGTNGDVLTVVSGAPAWQAPSGGGGGGYTQGARVYNNATITANHNTVVMLTFNSERYDTDGIHSTVTNTSRLTCQTAGKYVITGHVRWPNNSSGIRELDIVLNGATDIAEDARGAIGAVMGHSISTVYDLAVGDYVELAAYQNSGSNLVIDSGNSYSPEFAMQRIG